MKILNVSPYSQIHLTKVAKMPKPQKKTRNQIEKRRVIRRTIKRKRKVTTSLVMITLRRGSSAVAAL